MNKRLTKRHNRQISRAKARVRLSEPDVRTPEEIRAAKDASRPVGGWGNAAKAHYSRPSGPDHAGTASHSAAKTDV